MRRIGKTIKYLHFILLIFIMIFTPGFACYTEERQNEIDVFCAYWCGDWYGWGVISEATGDWEQYNGQRSDFIVTFTPNLYYRDYTL